MDSFVYFVSCDAFVKIGTSTRKGLWNRLSTLRTANPFLLRVEGLIYGDRVLENKLHYRFWADRERGEWYRFTDEIRQFIESTCPVNHQFRGEVLVYEDEEFCKLGTCLDYDVSGTASVKIDGKEICVPHSAIRLIGRL